MLQEDKMKLIDYTLGFIFPEKLKALLQESAAGELLRIRRSRKQRDTFRSWPLIGHQKFFLYPIKDENSWIWFVKSSIPRLPPVLENFRRRFSWPNWPSLGLRGGWFVTNETIESFVSRTNALLVATLISINRSTYHLYGKPGNFGKRSQMELFIPVEIFRKKVIPFEVLPFSHFYGNDRNFLYHLFGLPSARLHVERKRKIYRYLPKNIPVPFDENFAPKFLYKW